MNAKITATIAVAVVAVMVFAAAGAVTYSWFSDSEEANIDVNTATVKMDAKYKYRLEGTTPTDWMPVSGSDVDINNVTPNKTIDFTVGNYNNASTIPVKYYLFVEIIAGDNGIQAGHLTLDGKNVPALSAGVSQKYLIAGENVAVGAVPGEKSFTIATSTDLVQGESFSVKIISEVYQEDAVVSLPAELEDKGGDSKVANTYIVDPATSTTIPVSVNVPKAVANAASVSVKYVSSEGEASSDKITLDLSMTSTSGEPITNFGESDVTVSLTTPYPIGSVVYNGINGTEAHNFTCVANTSGTYDVSFTTTHFSEFVLNGASVMVGENNDVKYYVSFADAFKGLKGESGKITILDSHETAGVVLAKDQKISVDLNGKVLSLAQSYNNLMEVGSDAGVASIEIDATEDGSEIVAKRVLFKASEVSSKFNLTVDGGKYTCSYAFIIYGAHDVVFKNATFDVTEAAVWCGNKGPDTIKVSNCNVDSEDVGLYLGTIKGATLENNTVVSKNTAVEIKSGVVKITGGSYECSVYEKGGPINGDGTGAGTSTIVINNGYANIPDCGVNVSISGVALSNKAEGTHSPILIVTGPNNYNIVVTCDGKYIPDCFANTGAPGKIIYNNVEQTPKQVGSTTA